MRHRGVIDETGLSFSGVDIEARYRWPLVQEISAEKSAFVLWIDNAQGFLLPKRIFASEAEASAFLSFARAQIATAHGRPA